MTSATLAGRTAIVTGASAGIGRRLALELASAGMNLALAARSADKLQQVSAICEQQGVRALGIPTDVTDDAALESLVQRTRDEFGRIDVLVNNAGIEAWHDFHTLPVDDIRATVNVNLTAAMILTRLALPCMLEGG